MTTSSDLKTDATLFGNRFATQEVPSREFPETGMTALDAMRLVAGDGTGERLLAAYVRPVAPAWRPIGPIKFADSSAERFNVLTYVAGDGEIKTVNVDTGERL